MIFKLPTPSAGAQLAVQGLSWVLLSAMAYISYRVRHHSSLERCSLNTGLIISVLGVLHTLPLACAAYTWTVLVTRHAFSPLLG
jgi:hypothetical protein